MAEVMAWPLNLAEYAYNAEDVQRWMAGKTSGVYGAEGNWQVVSAGGMNLTVKATDQPGGWLSNMGRYGVVFWNGTDISLTVPTADGTLPRVDRVVVSWHIPQQSSVPVVEVRKGTPASNPVGPALVNDGEYAEICLAEIRLAAGQTEITADNIIDTRLNTELCGLVSAGLDKYPTDGLEAEFRAWFNALKTDLDGDVAANLLSNIETHKADTEVHLRRLEHAKSGTTHQLTGLTAVSGVVSCVFTATADFAAGDTVTVDGEAYAVQLSSGDAPADKLFVSGASVPVVVDKENKRVNFKAGGGYVKGDVIAVEYLEEVYDTKDYNYENSSTNPTGGSGFPYVGMSDPFNQITRHTAIGNHIFDENGNIVFELDDSNFRGASVDNDGNWYFVSNIATTTTLVKYTSSFSQVYSKDIPCNLDKVDGTYHSLTVVGTAISSDQTTGIILYWGYASEGKDKINLIYFNPETGEKLGEKTVVSYSGIAYGEHTVDAVLDLNSNTVFITWFSGSPIKLSISDINGNIISTKDMTDLRRVCAFYDNKVFGVNSNNVLCTVSSNGVVSNITGVSMGNTRFRVAKDAGVVITKQGRPYSLETRSFLADSPGITISDNSILIPLYDGKKGFFSTKKLYKLKQILSGYKVLEVVK